MVAKGPVPDVDSQRLKQPHPAVCAATREPRVLNRRGCRHFLFIEGILADAGYEPPKTASAIAKTGTGKIEIVKRTAPSLHGSSKAMG